MDKRGRRRNLNGWMLATLLLAGTHVGRAQTVSAVAKLDENRLYGTWYEVARLPNKRADAFELIAPGNKPNQLQLVDSCRTKKGFTDARNINANPQKKSSDARFKITTLWPFTRSYWVLALGPENEWALIGSPNHRNLWIFAKNPALKPELLADIEAKAAAEGFASAMLVLTPQNPQ